MQRHTVTAKFTAKVPVHDLCFTASGPVPGVSGWVTLPEFVARYENSATKWLKVHAPIDPIYFVFELVIMREILDKGSRVDSEAVELEAMGCCSAAIAWLYLILEHPSPEWMFRALWERSLHIQRVGYLVMNEEYISTIANHYLNMLRKAADVIADQKHFSWVAQNPGLSATWPSQPVGHLSDLFSPGKWLRRLVRSGKVTLMPRKRQRSPGANSSTCSTSNPSKRRRIF